MNQCIRNLAGVCLFVSGVAMARPVLVRLKTASGQPLCNEAIGSMDLRRYLALSIQTPVGMVPYLPNISETTSGGDGLGRTDARGELKLNVSRKAGRNYLRVYPYEGKYRLASDLSKSCDVSFSLLWPRTKVIDCVKISD